MNRTFDVNVTSGKCKVKLLLFSIPTGKRCTRLSKSDIRVQIVHSDHNATRGNDDEEDVKEPMVHFFVRHLCMPDISVDGYGVFTLML